MPNEKYIEVFKNKLNEFNRKYRTDLKISSFDKMNDAIRSFYVNGLEPAKYIALNDYKNEYKKLLTTTFSQDSLVYKSEGFMELVELLDTEALYLTDMVEKYGNNVSTLTRAPIIINKDGIYKSPLKFIHDVHGIITNIEKSTKEDATEESVNKVIYKQDQLALKNYYNIHEWINEQNDFIVDDLAYKNQKSIPFLQGGALSLREKNEIISNLIKDDVKKEHYEYDALATILKDTNSYHYENIEEKANVYLDYYDRTKEVATGEKKDRLINSVAPIAQMLMHKRASRSVFNVLIHPFRSHGETKAIERIVTKLANAIGEDYEKLKRDLKDNRIEVFDIHIQRSKKEFVQFVNAPTKNAEERRTQLDSLKEQLDKNANKKEEKKNEMSDFDKKLEEINKRREELKKEQESLENAYNEKYPEEKRVNVEIESEVDERNEEMLELINEVNGDSLKEPEIENQKQ